MNMKPHNKLYLLQFLLLFNFILGSSIHQHNHTNYFGNISTQPPFLASNSSISENLNCSHYSCVHRRNSSNDGIRISVNIPNHVPDICKGCEKPNGKCGAGLKCLCHPKECKDKVISKVGSIKSTCSEFFSLLSFFGTMAFLIMHA
uniref:Uncharacterized protein LOC101506551 n=1 Tax=Cicer arietinum TaxID=3827 RepID=A0A1S2YKG2_CICAR|nr:uncharacterized protein LOC101506551 [Cicer arietinum]